MKSQYLSKGDGEFRVSGGETSSVLEKRRLYHRSDGVELRLSQNDESAFLQSIKARIEEQLQATGCKILDAVSAETNYSIAYTDGKVLGWIDIWGIRGTGDSYRLVITITES